MAVTETPASTELSETEVSDGLTSRTLITGLGLATEGVSVLKVVGTEVLDVVDTTTRRALDVADEMVTELGGPLVDLARAPVTVARAAHDATVAGTRRLLAVA